MGATGAITHSLLAQEDVASRPIAISGYLPYSSGQVNTTYVRVLNNTKCKMSAAHAAIPLSIAGLSEVQTTYSSALCCCSFFEALVDCHYRIAQNLDEERNISQLLYLLVPLSAACLLWSGTYLVLHVCYQKLTMRKRFTLLGTMLHSMVIGARGQSQNFTDCPLILAGLIVVPLLYQGLIDPDGRGHARPI